VLVDWVSVAARLASLVLALQAAGAAIFLVLFRREVVAAEAAIVRLGRASAAFAFMMVAAHYALEAGRLAGSLTGVLDGDLQRLMLGTTSAASAGLRLVGLALLAAALWMPAAYRNGMRMMLGAFLVAASFAFTGHTVTHPPQIALRSLVFVHVLLVAFWFGALAPLDRTLVRESAADAGRIIERFSRIATFWVPWIAVVGAVMAALLMGRWPAIGSPYAKLLLAKVAGFVLLMFLAAANRWRLGPAVGRGEPGAARRFRGALALEAVLIVAVLGATAVLTTFHSPEAPDPP
jgi:putative copper resistance protein D